LVSFQANQFDEDDELFSAEAETAKDKMARQKNLLVRRAVDCGLQLLARLSHYRVYLTAEERTKHRSPETGEIDRRTKSEKNQRFFLFDGGTTSTSSQRSSSSRESLPLDSSIENLDHTYAQEYSTAFNFWNFIPLIFGKKGRKNKVYATRRASNTSDTTKEEQPDAIDLELHIALSCGDVTNVILGDTFTPHPSSSSSPPASPTSINKKQKRFSHISIKSNTIDKNTTDYTLIYKGRLEYAICGPAVESLEDALAIAKAGEMSITPEAYEIFEKQVSSLSYEKRKQFFVVKSSQWTNPPTRKGGNNSRPLHTKRYATSNANYLADRPGLMTRAATLKLEPLIPRTRDASLLELLNDSNPNYTKYINRSALYRLEHSPDGNFLPQFRDCTIMFISLGKLNVATTEGMKIAQKATYATIQALVKYEGKLRKYQILDIWH
jgi:hypothetical protein